MRRVIIVSAVLAALAALPTIASAQSGAPESGVGEYTENIPGAGGNQPENGGGQGGSGGSGGSGQGGSGEAAPGGTATDTGLPPEVVNEFEQQGADGAAAAALAQSTSPSGSNQGAGQPGSGGQAAGDAGQISSGDGQGGVGGVVEKIVGVNSASQSDGMGIALPVILGSSLLAALLFLFVRRRGLGPGNA